MPATYGELHVQLKETEQQLKVQLEEIQRIVREDGVGYSNHMADVGTEVIVISAQSGCNSASRVWVFPSPSIVISEMKGW